MCTANGSHHCDCPNYDCEIRRQQNRRIVPLIRSRLLGAFFLQAVITWGVQALIVILKDLPVVVAFVAVGYVVISFRNLGAVVRIGRRRL